MKMTAIYGSLWSSRTPDKFSTDICAQEWESGLVGFSEKEVYGALEELKRPGNHFEEHPPTLPQFVGICVMIRKKNTPVQVFRKGEPLTRNEHDDYRLRFKDFGYPAECIAGCHHCADRISVYGAVI